MVRPTAEEMLVSAKRELTMRQRVYPRRVADGKMTQKAADHEIACMAAIVDICGERAEKERLL